ncbi:MAG: hypothetical protein ABI323_15055 [Solirubrobacteraceae bacterium]
MRKLVGLLVGLAVLAVGGTAIAGPAATNSNGDFLDLNLAVTPPVSSTAHTPHGVGLVFNEISGNRVNANNETANTSIVVRFNQNFTDNGLRFPACTINTKALSQCSKASQVGSGTAEGQLLSSGGKPPTYVPATVKIYNGKPYKGKAPTQIYIASVSGKPEVELDFRITRVAGGLDFTELQFPGATAGPPIYLTKFAFKVGDRSEMHKVKGKKVRIHLFNAPTSCHGAWTYTQTLLYAKLPPLIATASQPCVKG